jgi:metal-sulfur cluster biosynthetic enzyme
MTVPETADRAGRSAADLDGVPPSAPSGETSLATLEDIEEALKDVVDPELGVNIVDLGLVYDIDLQENGDVDIRYSLTTMGCPIGPMIEDQMRAFLAPLEGLGDVRPELVFRPAWSPEMMSEEAKAALGVF